MKRKLRTTPLLIVLSVALLCFLSACESDISDFQRTDVRQPLKEEKVNECKAQKTFAKILSVAVSKSSALRAFLKQEAEKQYDKDYDVFYPFVKDKIIENGQTLRDILVSCSSEREMDVIENSVPRLTIMIPELSSFGAFGVHKWNTSDNHVAVTYVDGNSNSVFYAEGDSLLSLPGGNLPDFPFMVVKENERMKVVGKTEITRASENMRVAKYQYDFADPAFDGTQDDHTRAYTYSYDIDNTAEPSPDDKPYLKRDSIDQKCIEAYNLSKNNQYLIDREYSYYGLSPYNPSNGKLDPTVREKLYKFRVSPSIYNKIIDEKENKDPRLKDGSVYDCGIPSDSAIAKSLWTDGAFEFVFEVFMGNSNVAEAKIISESASNVFYISNFHVTKRHKTFWRHSRWWYSTTVDRLRGRWIDLSSENIYLTNTWDLSNSPVNAYIKIFEKDDGKDVTETESYTASYVNKADLGLSGGIGDKTKFNLGFSKQITGQKTYSITSTYHDKDDELGNVTLNFKDPVIVSDKYASTKGYELYSLNTGSIDVVIAPTSIR